MADRIVGNTLYKEHYADTVIIGSPDRPDPWAGDTAARWRELAKQDEMSTADVKRRWKLTDEELATLIRVFGFPPPAWRPRGIGLFGARAVYRKSAIENWIQTGAPALMRKFID